MESPNKNILNLAEGAGFGLIGKFIGRFLGLLGDIIAARMLGPATFGLYSIGWTLFRLMEIVAPLGMDRGALRFLPRFIGKDRAGLKSTILQTIVFSLAFGCLLGVAVYLGSSWLGNSVFRKPDLVFTLKIFAFGVPVAALLPVVAAITRADATVKYAVLIQDFSQPFFALILMLIFYYVGERLLGILYADILSYLFATLLGLWCVYRLYPFLFMPTSVGGSITGELLKYSIPVAFGGVFTALIYWVDRLFVGYFRTGTETGIYQVASQISLLFAVVLSGLSTTLAPHFSRLHYRNDRNQLQQVYRIGNKWGLYLGLPFISIFVISPQRVLTVLYGMDYSPAWLPMLILLFGQAVNLAVGASAPLLVMAGGQNIWFVLTVSSFGLDVLLNFLMTPNLGMVGAAIATSISMSFLFISVLLTVYRKFDVWPYDRRYLKGLVSFCCAMFAVWSAGKIALPEFGILTIQSIASVSVFCIVLVLLKLDQEDVVFINLLRQRLLRTKNSDQEIEND